MTEIVVRADKKKVVVSRVVDDVEVAREKIDPDTRAQRARAGKSVGATEQEILQWAVKAQATGEPQRVVVVDPPKPPAAIVVRGFTDRREDGVPYDCDGATFVRCHLQSVPVTDLIDWTDGDALCCLDVDYHEKDRDPPPRDWLDGVVRTKLHPAPHAWHFSRGGGLHLFYTAAQPFTATELAAAAALRFKTIDPRAGVELKKVVRGPGDEAVSVATAQATAVALSPAGGRDEADPAEVAEWLEDRDLKAGHRYDHDRCPMHPTPGDKGTNQPVTVREDGVYCFDCAAKGRRAFAHWPSLLGNPAADDVAGMVRGLCHWGHAKYVLVHKYGMVESLARIAYRAAVKAHHRDLPTAELAPLVDGTQVTDAFTRVGPVWTTIEQSIAYPKDLARDILPSLPACMYPSAEGPKPDKAKVAEFLTTKNLSGYGYPDVEVVHGMKLAQPYLPPPKAAVIPVPHPTVRGNCAPRYVPKARRMKEDAAWDVLCAIWPGLDRGLVRLCIASFGCAQETKLGMQPIVFVHGSSGYGKTKTVQIAAGVFGTQAGDAPFNHNTERFRQALQEAGQQGPCVLVNEILKDAANGVRRLTAKEALDPLLNLTPDSLSHKLYTGSIRFGRVPAIYLTEPKIPLYMAAETQLARRIREWEVKGRKDRWKETVPPSGVDMNCLQSLRAVGREIAAACDAVVSEVVDEFFAVPTTWDAIANRLGCKTLEESDEFENPTVLQREFFDLVCQAPDLTGRDLKLYPGGYKKIDRNTQTELEKDLLAVYSQFSDNGNWLESRTLTAADWSTILKVDDNVNLDVTSDGVNVFVRFRVGPMKKPYRVNNAVVRQVEPAVP